MSHPQLQFVDHDDKRGVFTCQFCNSDDPRETTRFAHTTLIGLKTVATQWFEFQARRTGHHWPKGHYLQTIQRIDNMANRIAERLATPPNKPRNYNPYAGDDQ